jgi:hypothetical protein
MFLFSIVLNSEKEEEGDRKKNKIKIKERKEKGGTQQVALA